MAIESRERNEMNERSFWEQFELSYDGEPMMWTPETIAAANAKLEPAIREPFRLTEVDI